MQKIVDLSNSRDYTEQGDINENKYFKRINGLLEQGWTIAQIMKDVVESDADKPIHKETFVAFVILEKPDEEK